MDLELIQRFAVTLAIGLLIGIERGWDDQETRETPRIAGVRTFALIALLGALWQLFGSQFGPLLLAVGFFGFAALYVSASWLEARGTGHYGITTEVAAFITFTLGAMTMHGYVLLSAATAVIVTIILSAKPILHRWLERLERRELYAILKLLLISVVLLPALPNRGFGPWQAINPYEMWWTVVLICALSFVGYFAQKLAGARRGVILTSLFGGLVSSTATTLSFSRQARAEPALASL
ncbi:MAG: MgtC/SapB family protein, partial [Gammaproteobacteria bacterium]